MPRLNPGDPFPKLTLGTTDGQLTTVSDAFACDVGVVLFYPGAARRARRPARRGQPAKPTGR
jgi:peroxiredoxin